MSIKNTVFMMIKPDATQRGKKTVRDILEDIKSRGWSIVIQEERTLDESTVAKFYQEHADKPFYGELIEYITSGKVIVLAVRVPSVEEARKVVGSTDPKTAEEGTIRNKFGLTKSNNSIHCSDSDAAAEYELGLFFKIFDNIKIFAKPIEKSNLFEFYAVTSRSPILIGAGPRDAFKVACESIIKNTLFKSIEISIPKDQDE